MIFFLFAIFFSTVFTNDQFYLSSLTFRKMADFIIDPATPFDPQKVQDGDIIYVESSILYFFAQHQQPKISKKYVLITHGHDQSIPGNYAHILNDPNLIAWFAQNVDQCSHPKLYPIPIGIYRNLQQGGLLKYLDQIRTKAPQENKEHLLYMNFCIGTNTKDRSFVYDIFKNKNFCFVSGRKSYENYLKDIASSKFILSPFGGGIDCYRTWETLYIAEAQYLENEEISSVPVVQTSDLNPLYEGLPVIVIKDWNEVTEEFLNQKYKELQGKKYNFEKIHAKYWRDLIYSKRADYRK